MAIYLYIGEGGRLGSKLCGRTVGRGYMDIYGGWVAGRRWGRSFYIWVVGKWKRKRSRGWLDLVMGM